MGKSTSCYPSLVVERRGSGVVSHTGAVALLGTAQRTGLSGVLSEALAPWRKPMRSHDPGKIVLDLAVALAVGGDCLADIGVLRAEPAVFGSHRVTVDQRSSRLLEPRRETRRGRSPGIARRITASTPSTHW